MRLIYNSDAQRLQKNFDDKTPVTVSELFRSERTASVPIELFLVDNDGGYATPGSSDYEVLIGRQAQAVTTGKLTLTFTGTTEEIDLSKPKLATRIEAALNAVSEVNAAGGVDVVELKNGRAFQITFRSVGSRAAITAGVKDSMQPASVLISEVTAGTGSTREVQLLTLEEASLAEISTSGWSANSNPALTITTLVEGTANTREVVQLSVSNDPAPGSFFVVSNSEPISTEATAAQVKTILNSALSNDIGSVKKTGERIWQITYKTNGDKTALSAGTHNLVKRPSVNGTLSLNTTALAYAANSDGSDLSVGFTLKKSNEVLLSENVDLAEPFAEVIGSSAMLNNDSLGALFTIAGDDVNKGTAISLSGGLTYSSDTLAAPFLPLAGGTMTGDVLFGDNVKAKFGTDSDLQVYHLSGNNYVSAITGGNLFIQGNTVSLRSVSQENLITATANGAVSLFYDAVKKLETTDTGATISGKLIVNGDLDVSGTTTTFNSSVVTVDDPVFTVGGDTAPVASDNKDRGIEFRYFRSGESAKVGFFGYSNADDAFKLLTSATNNSEVFSGTLADLKCGNILLADDNKIKLGDDGDLEIFYNTDSFIKSSAELKIASNVIRFLKNDLGEYTANFIGDAGVELFYDGSKTFETISGGCQITGNLGIGGTPTQKLSVIGGHIELDDNRHIQWGGSNNKITGNDASDYIRVFTAGNEAARFDSSGRLGVSSTSPEADIHLGDALVNGFSVDRKTLAVSDITNGAQIILRGQSPRIWFDSTNSGSGEFYLDNSNLKFFQGTPTTPTGELMRLNSTGLGIGVTPSAVLHVSGGSSTIPSISTSFPFVVSNSTNSGLCILTGDTTSAGQLVFGDTDASVVGRIRYQHSDNSLRFWTNFAERMRIDSSGNVGIGNTNPSAQLTIHDGSPGQLLFHTYEQYNETKFYGYNDQTGNGCWEFINDGTWDQTRFYIQDANNSDTRLTLDIKGNNGATDIIAATSSGNVGIGTTSPDSKIEISGTDSSTTDTFGLKISNEGSTTNSNGGILFKNYDNHGAWIRSIRTGSANGKLSFGTNSGAGIAESNISERMVIDHNGNVGISTASPSANADLTLGNGELCMAETTTPTADANFGKIYCKSDNKLYFQDGAGTEHEIAFV